MQPMTEMEMADQEKQAITPQDLITEEHIRKTLIADKGNDARLVSWEVKNFTKQGDNYACVVTSVEVKYKKGSTGEESVSYVVKLNPCRSMADMEPITHIVFGKESSFYMKIVPEINEVLRSCGKEPMRFPRCFYSTLESKKEQIYFEDMRSKKFKMFDRRKGMDVEHASLVLHELARLHAASHLLLTKSPDQSFEEKYDFLSKDWLSFTEDTKDTMLEFMKGNFTNASAMLKKVGYKQKAIDWTESLVPLTEFLLTKKMKSERFNSINHGDCWNNNVLFRYDDDDKPVDVILLDLQVCREASVAVDLNYFLYTSLTDTVRVPNLKNFLYQYHSSYKEILEAGGKDMFFNEEELMTEFRDKNVLGALFAMLVVPAVLMESDQIPDYSKESDIEKVAADFRAKTIEMLDSNPLFKPRFLGIFEELIETGLIS